MTPSVRAAGGREGQQEQHHCHHQQQRSSAAASPPPSARRRHRPRAAASPCAAAAASAAAALLRSALAPEDKTSHISMSRFCRAYKTCMTPWHDRPAFEPALLCCRFESRWSCPRGATRIARVCACDKTRSRSERRCFCCRGRAATSRLFWRRCSAVSRRARWRRRGVGAAINRAPAASGAERLPT